MSIRSNFKKWIVGFGALGGAMFFYPNDNDNNSQFLHTHKFGIATSGWDHNWDRYIYIFFSIVIIVIRINISQYNM